MSIRLLFSLLVFVAAALVTHNGHAKTSTKLQKLLSTKLLEAPLSSAAVSLIPGCKERTLRHTIYPKCRNSRQMYAKVLKRAKRKDQPLVIIFGFDKCPACRDLQNKLFNKRSPMKNADIFKYLSEPAIDLYVNSNRPLKLSTLQVNVRSRHGQQLAKDLGVMAMTSAMNGPSIWSPFVLFVNPHTGQSYSSSDWRGKGFTYCDWGAEFAAGIEGIGMAKAGKSFRKRKRC